MSDTGGIDDGGRRRWSRAVGLLAAGALLVWGALPYLPGQIDDTYIVFAYAHRIVQHGEIAWNTGIRVEGYSSPLHLALMAVGAAAGADLALFARALAFLWAVGVLALLARRSIGPDRIVLVLLVAAWQPFAFWSTAGLETSLATLLGVLAWPLVLGDRLAWARGTLVLVLLSITRPEGLAWLGLGLARRLFHGRATGRPEVGVGLGLAALGAYHGVRVAYFGELLPTPYLVKIAAIDAYGSGVRQAARELASAAGLLIATVVLRRRIPAWSWLPLAVQAGLLVRAGGDWMGHARFLLPGLLASVAAAWTHGQPRAILGPARSVVLGGVAVLGVAGFMGEPSHEGWVDGRGRLVAGWRDPWFLRHPAQAVRTPWAVALLEETSFLIERVPPGAGASMSDVGLPGNLDDVRIWDDAGLTDRVTARILASPSQDIVEEILDRYRDDDDVWCIRYGLGPGGAESADPWITEPMSEVSPSRSGSAHLVWRCRPGGAPSAEVVAARWQRLLMRYPSQDWIRWYAARAELAAGRVDDGLALARGAFFLGEESLGWVLFGEGQSAAYHPGRGWALYTAGARRSLALPDARWDGVVATLDVDDPGEEGARVRLGWDPPCGDAVERMVREPVTVELPACTESGDRSLVVEFSNDEARDGFDRNVFVGLTER